MPFPTSPTHATAEHVLVVVDWTLDPHAVVASLSARDTQRRTVWSLLVPAWLHGLDWAGDPRASAPCAERALLTLRELAVAAGLELALAVVGDPHPITAVNDARAAVRCDAILLCTRDRHFSRANLFDLAHRMLAGTGLRVTHELLPEVRRGHCSDELPRAA